MEQFYDLKENQPEPDLATIRAVEGNDNDAFSPLIFFCARFAFLGANIAVLCAEQNDGEQDDGYAVHPKVLRLAIYAGEMSSLWVGLTYCCRLF